MNMHPLDWAIIVAIMLLLLGVALFTQRLNRSVADFLAANRCAGRYLLTMADGMAGLGAITIAASFEQFYESGFGGLWWSNILAPVWLILSLTGFVIYRYRETRVLTMAEFFERRYSRRFRIYAGFLAFISGILNYGIFPAVTSRFLVYFTGLPLSFPVLDVAVPTEPVIMIILLCSAVFVTLSGGQIAVMVTDFLQGQLVNVTMLVVLAVLITTVSWSDLMKGLSTGTQPGQSMINPFQQGNLPDFNPLFFFMAAAVSVYGFKAWQGSQGYNASAKSPHEAKMAGILAAYRGTITTLLILLLPLYAYAVLHLDSYAATQASVDATLSQLGDPQLVKQMRVPVTLSEILPVGVMGLFAAVIVMAAISTDDTYLHSWGSIFIQDVVMPFRNKALKPKTHMWLLRGAVVGVAVFAFCFSMLFTLRDYIFMWFQITGAIFLGGAGVAILGGLYWKRGTVEGAWTAMIIGPILAVSGIVTQNIVYPDYITPQYARDPGASVWKWLPHKFPLNGMEMTFGVAMICMVSYAVVSLLSGRSPIDMDKLLNRGAFALESDGHHPAVPADPILHRDKPLSTRLLYRLGMSNEFTRGDRFIFWLKLGLFLPFFLFFLVVTLLHFGITAAGGESWFDDDFFRGWWLFRTAFVIVLGVITTFWFLIGGFHNLFALFRTLRDADRDVDDDGTVKTHDHLQETDRSAQPVPDHE